MGPPRNIDWTLPWHEILHQWNGRIQRFMGQSKCKPWSEICLRHAWNLAHYFALPPDHRWLKRVLHWNPCGRKLVGRPKHSWDSILANFCRFKDGRWLLWIRICGAQCFLSFWTSASADVHRKQFHICSPVRLVSSWSPQFRTSFKQVGS